MCCMNKIKIVKQGSANSAAGHTRLFYCLDQVLSQSLAILIISLGSLSFTECVYYETLANHGHVMDMT